MVPGSAGTLAGTVCDESCGGQPNFPCAEADRLLKSALALPGQVTNIVDHLRRSHEEVTRLRRDNDKLLKQLHEAQHQCTTLAAHNQELEDEGSSFLHELDLENQELRERIALWEEIMQPVSKLLLSWPVF